MDDVKNDDKTSVSVADAKDDKGPSQEVTQDVPEATNPPKAEVKPTVSAVSTDVTSQQSSPEKEVLEKESREELNGLLGILVIVLAAGMIGVGTIVFARDALLFFAGLFLYFIVAPPGTFVKGKSKMASFTKEVALAFALCFAVFLVLKAVLPALLRVSWEEIDQAKVMIFVLTVLGVKLVFFPYYNFRQDD
jgi:uncharacterized membrane protein